jgi:vacuolar-type H+-ATPase subunit F/Vma7
MIAVGPAEDLRGFALAGVETARCQTPQDAAALFPALAADETVGLVLVPAWLERTAPASIARVRSRRRAPVILALPDDDGGAGLA